MKRNLIVTLAFLALTLMLIGGFVAVVDPYQYYGAHDTYVGSQRMEIAGVARHHDYDAVILGSSMAMNHYPSQADSLLGWKTKNFSMMGATDDEYAIVVPYILKQGKTRHAVWGLDFFSFARQRGAVPEYMYDGKWYTDCKYLYNYSSLRSAITYATDGGVPEQGLYHFRSDGRREDLIKSYQATVSEGYFTKAAGGELFDFEQMKERFDATVLPIVKDNPDVEWHIYLPPYSVAEFIIYDRHDVLNDNLMLRNHIASQLEGLANVRLYDFQTRAWIANLDEYSDVRHHSHTYNRDIIRAIASGTDIADADAVAANSDSIRALVKQYADSLDSAVAL